MRKPNSKRRWRILRAFAFGLIATAFTVYWPATVQDLYRGAGHQEYSTTNAPTYLGDLIPEYSAARIHTPRGKCDGMLMPTPDFGIDVINYFYGDTHLKWDLERDGIHPPAFGLSRYRFGFPMRAAYWDDYSIPAGGTAQSIKAYFDPVKQRAGRQMGIQYPDWLLCDSYARRLPAMPIWTGLIFNLFFWSIFWMGPGTIWRTVRKYRRKRRGLCLACGYAVEDLATCPECGTDHAAC